MTVHTKKKEFQEQKNTQFMEDDQIKILLFPMPYKPYYQPPNSPQKQLSGPKRRTMAKLQNT